MARLKFLLWMFSPGCLLHFILGEHQPQIETQSLSNHSVGRSGTVAPRLGYASRPPEL